MDLRVKKTKNSIRKAYLQEKKDKTIPEIRVTQLCAIAGINKTTFYKHYRDIYDLADKLETQIIAEILSECQYLEELFSDTEKCVSDIILAFCQHTELLQTVFDDRTELMISKVEHQLIDIYLSGLHSKKEEVLIKFCIGGASNVLLDSIDREDVADTVAILVNLIQKMDQIS